MSWRPSWGRWASWAASPTIWGHKRPSKPRLQWPVRWGAGSLNTEALDGVGSVVLTGRHNRASEASFSNGTLLCLFLLRPPVACWPWPPSPKEACWATVLDICSSISPTRWRRTADMYVRMPLNDLEPVLAPCFIKTFICHRWRLSTVMLRRKWSNLKWGFSQRSRCCHASNLRQST